MKYLIGAALNSNNHAEAELLLTEEGTPAANQVLYGLKFGRGAYAEAQTLLNAMPSSTQDDIWFKQVQEINIARMQAGPGYVLTAPQKSLLNTVAHSGSPVRGYAQGILTFLTGERFERQLPVAGRSRPTSPQPTKVGQQTALLVSPNPATGRFTVTFGQALPLRSEIQITDLYGRVILRKDVSDMTAVKIGAEVLTSGVYVVTVRLPDGMTQQQKVVVNR